MAVVSELPSLSTPTEACGRRLRGLFRHPSHRLPMPEETSACGGNLAPIWTADEYLGDLDWITRIEDRFGEERVHELRRARREWAELGKPVPETDPGSDMEDPPDE